jgi:hypothetical protein
MAATYVPSADEVRAMLLSWGWSEEARGDAGRFLSLGSGGVALPYSWAGDVGLAHSVIERVATQMDRSPNELWQSVLTSVVDSIYLCFVGETLHRGSLPLGAAFEALRNGKRLLASSGTSVITPVRSIYSRYHPEAQALARDARMEHTEDGSFVFPLRISLGSDIPDLSTPEVPLVPEPYARRVTRTLAQSLGLTHALTEEDVDRIPEDQLDDAAAAGVTRETCQSLSDIMKSDAIDRVQIKFGWGSSVAPPKLLTSEIEFNRSARPQLRKLAKRLSVPTVDPSQRFTGTIREIGQVTEASEYHFTLNTYHYARPATLRVSIDAETHAKAVHWYEDRATVVVRGTLIEGVSGLRMDETDGVQAFVMDHLSPE